MRLYERGMTYSFSLCRYVLNYVNTPRKIKICSNKRLPQKNLLVWIDWPGVGDLFTALDSIYKLYLGAKEEYRVSLACSSNQKRILEAMGFSYFDNIIVISTNIESYTDFRNNVDSLNVEYWDTIILMDSMTRMHRRVLLCLRYNLLYEANYKDHSVKNKMFDKIIRSKNKLNANPLEWIVENRIRIVERFFLDCIADDKFINSNYIMPKLSSDDKGLVYKYCIISPGVANGHSHEQRAWPVEHFCVVVNYILSHSDLNVVITGDKNDFYKGEHILNKSIEPSRVHNFAGKTSLKEWICLIQDARFVFGNDSGYIHVAALAGTPSFVLTGFWNYGRFLPYKASYGNLVLPVVIKTKQPECSFCAIYKRRTQSHSMCDDTVKAKGIFKCIAEISPDLVIKEIRRYL